MRHFGGVVDLIFVFYQLHEPIFSLKKRQDLAVLMFRNCFVLIN